jgi:hypothetical protein
MDPEGQPITILRYELLWRPDVDTEHVTDFFIHALGLVRTSPSHAANDDLYIGVIHLEPSSTQIAVQEFGLPAVMSMTIEVHTTLDDEPFDALVRNLMLTVVQFILTHDLDVYILDRDEHVILRREHGTLTLHDVYPRWRNLGIDKLIPQPFTRIPSPDTP